MAFTLEDSLAPEDQFHLDGTSPVPTDRATSQRAVKADYGLGKDSPGVSSIATATLSGKENDLRQNIRNEEALRWDMAKTAFVTDVAQKNGGKLTPEDRDFMLELSRNEYANGIDDILEKRFAERFTGDTLAVHGLNFEGAYARAGQLAPQEASNEVDIYTGVVKSNEYEKTQLENLHSEWQKTGWLASAPHYAGQLVPLLSAYRLHDAISKAPTTSILPGDNLGQQIAYLKSLPYEQRKAAYDQALTDLKSKNMLTALEFAQAVVSFNATDSFLSNAFGVADAGTLASGLAGQVLNLGRRIGTKAATSAAKELPMPEGPGAPKLLTYQPKLPAPEVDKAMLQEMQKQADITPPKTRTYIPEGSVPHIEAIEQGQDIVTGWTAGKTKFKANDGHVFIDAADAEKLKINPGDRVLTYEDGTVAVSRQQPDGQWSIPFDSQKVGIETTPAPGKIAVNLGTATKPPGVSTLIYKEAKVGDKVASIETEKAGPQFYTDRKNGITVQQSKTPEEGMIAVDYDDFGGLTFGERVMGKDFYIPEAAARTMAKGDGGVKVVNGEPTFFTDIANGVSVEMGQKGPGMVPVTVSKDGKYVKFHETIPEKEAIEDMRTALKDSAKAVADTKMDVEDITATMGDIPKSAEIRAVKKITGQIEKNAGISAVSDDLPSALNPTNFFGNGKALSRDLSQRIAERFSKSTEALESILGQLHVPRGTTEAVLNGIKDTSAKLQREYGGRVNDGIIDFLHIPPELNPNKANLDTVVMRIGTPQGTAFTSRAQAVHYFKEVYEFSAGEAQIMQKGASWYISVSKYVDETTDAWRNAVVTPKNSTPVNMWNMMLSRLRSSEDLIAEVQRDNRKIATHAPQVMNRAIKEQIEETRGKLTSKQRKEVGQMLEINRDAPNPLFGPEGRGKWYETAADFEQAFMGKFQKMPTGAQVEHYYNYTRLSDFDWTLRNLAMFRDKARLGLEQFAFKADKGTIPWFEGKQLEKMPWGGQDAGIWFQEAGKAGQFLSKHDMVNSPTGMTKTQLEKLINEQGYKVYQIASPTKRPLADTLGVQEQIHFVVTNGMERKALNFKQLEYRPGGHSIYPDQWFVKQPVLQMGAGGRLHYYGDNAVMNFATEAQAKKYAQAFDTAREMLKNNDPKLPGFLAKNLPYDLDVFKRMFLKGHLDADTPIVHTYTGTNTFDTNTMLKRKYDGFVDATKSEYNLEGMMDKSFQADRDGILNTVNEKVFKIGQSRQLDPYVALNKGLAQGIQNLWTGDYKIGSVQSWLEEFGDVMKPNFKTLSNNPMFFLYNPQFNESIPDKARLAAAKASRLAIVNFLGVQSEVGTKINYVQNKMASFVYESLGQNASEMFADHMLPAIRDPAKYARAVAFHTKLGFFNPIQAVVQAQSLAHVLAVAGPKNGLPSFGAAMLARRLAHNEDPSVLADFAKKAGNLGYDPEHFKEMVQGLRANGLFEVAGETAMRDDVMDPKLYNSTVGRWLDKGTMFFAEGERAVRLAAYATSFREWRLANPKAVLDNREMGRIMTRSDDLSLNMTRASAASWQQGVLSIPLQFMAFNARLAEQLLPGTSRLSTAEKLRAYGTYATLYGVPTAAAAATGIWPYYDDIKEAAMKRGINVSEGYMQALMEGLPQFIISAATGHDYNIASRLGPGGNSLLRDAISGEKSAIQLAGGASASIIGDIWSSTDPVRRAVASVFTGDSEYFPLKTNDWMNVLRNISTLDLGMRIKGWAEYGKYISKNGVQVGEMDGMDAAMAILGLSPQHIADTYVKQKAGKADAKTQKGFEDLALRNYALAIQAGANGDEQTFRDYMTRVSAYVKAGDLNVEDQQKLYNRARQYRPDLEDKVNWDFVRNAPNSQYSARFNEFFINQKAPK